MEFKQKKQNTIKCNIQWPSHFCSFNDVKQLNVKTKNGVFQRIKPIEIICSGKLGEKREKLIRHAVIY